MKTALFTKVFVDRTLEKTFELAAELGYDGIELMCREPHLGPSTTPERAESLAGQLDALDLDVVCLATYTGEYVDVTTEAAEAELEALETYLELADIFDTDLLRHGVGGPPERRATAEHYEEAASWYRRAADLAAEYGATLGIEIHADRIVETADAAVELVERIDRENVGVIHDAGNMYITDANFGTESVETLGDHLCHVHVKDELRIDDLSRPGAFELETNRGSEVFEHRLLGHGGADHSDLFAALAAAGYEGYVSNECHRHTTDVWTDVTVAAHELEAMERLIEVST